MSAWPRMCRAVVSIVVVLAAGCGAKPAASEASGATGVVELALSARGSRGNLYRLSGAVFEVEGPTETTLSGDGENLVADVPVGTYRVELRDGWQLIRVADELAVNATVRDDSLEGVMVRESSTTAVRFTFDLADGEEVGFGRIEVGIEVNEGQDDAPVCAEPCVHGACLRGLCACDEGFMGPTCAVCTPESQAPACRASANAPEASVTRGVAPLGVFFDASNVPGLADGNFLEADVIWDFGDHTDTGYFATTGLPKSRATGFVAGHVFEQPGRYEVKARLIDVAGVTHEAESVLIEVVPFDGTTRCVSSDGDFAGAPSGCDERTSADITAELTWVVAEPNRRLLLRRGDHFAFPAMTTFEGAGPSVVGAFGPAADARPQIDCNGLGEAMDFRSSDLRVMDVDFTGCGIGFGGTNQVALRLDVHDSPFVGVGIGGRQVFLADSRVERHSYFGSYIDGSRMSLTGNVLDQLRVATSFLRPASESRDVYVAHNVIDASRSEPTTGIKFHSRRGVITDNVIVAGLSRIAITTDSGDELTSVDEGLGLVLVERNLLRLSFDAAKPHNDAFTDAGVSFNTHDRVVIRTNVLHGMSRAFVDSSGGAEPAAQHVRIYNNSVAKLDAPGLNADEGDFLSLGSPPRGLDVFNNAITVSGTLSVGMIRLRGVVTADSLGALTMEHNAYFHAEGSASDFLYANDEAFGHTLSGFQARGFESGSFFASPDFVSVDAGAARVTFPAADSPLIDAGRAASTSLDFGMNPRLVGARVDIGAWEFASP